MKRLAISCVVAAFSFLAFPLGCCAEDAAEDKPKAQRIDLGDQPDERPDNEIGYGEAADQPAFSGQNYGFDDPMNADSGADTGKIDEED